jgi:hypothetical protein
VIRSSEDDATYVLYGLEWNTRQSRSVIITARTAGRDEAGSYATRPAE